MIETKIKLIKYLMDQDALSLENYNKALNLLCNLVDRLYKEEGLK